MTKNKAITNIKSKLGECILGAFNNYVDKMRGGGGQKMSVFVHPQGIKTVHAGRGIKKFVHVVVE